MNIVMIITGSILVVFGILSITKKWLWLQQGFCKRPVHVDSYMKYMGIIDIVIGALCLALGLIYRQSETLLILAAIITSIMLVLIIVCEVKYRKFD